LVKAKRFVPLSKFHVEYIEYSRSEHRPKTTESINYIFGQFTKFVGDVLIHKVTIRQIEQFLSHKKQNTSDVTAQRYFLYLASGFECARRWKYIDVNPFREIKKPKLTEKPPAYFTKENFHTLLSVVDEPEIRSIILVAIHTGMRRGEIINLKWEHVDFVRKVVSVESTETFTTKSKRNRTIPMAKTLYTLLAERKEAAICEYVFHNRMMKPLDGHSVSQKFKKYVREAKLDDRLNFHGLRHSFASWLAMNGTNIYEISKLLGHSSVAVTQVYAHLAPEERHETVDLINYDANISVSTDVKHAEYE
jgi:integrase